MVVCPSLWGLGCDSRRALRVTALSCQGSWTLQPHPAPAQCWQRDLASTKTTQASAGSRNVGSRLQSQ